MQDQQPEPEHRWRYRWFPGVAIIAVGAIFLISNLGAKIPFLNSRNWWAWLILIGALVPLTRAYELFRACGKVDAKVAHALLNAGALVLFAAMFLLNLNLQVWWPLFVILGGLLMLVRRPYRGRRYYR